MTMLQDLDNADTERNHELNWYSSDPEPPNLPLLRKTLEWAEAEAEQPRELSEWYQGSWITKRGCGTACCIAGKVAIDNGAVSLDQIDAILQGVDFDDLFQGDYIGDFAKRELGLLEIEAEMLFFHSNNIDELWEIGNWIAARSGERLR